jgi:hypothetical protein
MRALIVFFFGLVLIRPLVVPVVVFVAAALPFAGV